MERVETDGETLAIVLRRGLKVQGVKFFTPEEFPFQLGIHMRRKGEVIKSHIHLSRKRVIEKVQEMLYIRKGVVEVEVFDLKGNKVNQCLLREGDTILFADGGHGIKVLEDCEIVEVKQGPYSDSLRDKKLLN